MTESHKIYSIEVFRGIAALLVVLFHYNFYLSKYLNTELTLSRLFEGGHAGVEFFFVLSGFIIYLTHRKDIGVSEAGGTFLKKRIIRIIPMYWIVITLSVISFYAHPAWGEAKSLTIRNIIFDYLLLPTGGNLVLAPAWTLKYEAIFYWFFLLIIVRPPVGMAVFIFWQLSILLFNALAISGIIRPDLPYAAFALDIHEIGFGVGMFCAWWIVTRPAASRVGAWVLLGLSVGSVIGALTFEAVEHLNFADLQSFAERSWISLWYTLSFAMIVVSAARLEAFYKPVFGAWLVTFGASSYSLYLIHDPLVSLLGKAAASSKIAAYVNANVIYLCAAGIAIAAAVAVHRLIEKPISAASRRLLASGPRSARVSAASRPI